VRLKTRLRPAIALWPLPASHPGAPRCWTAWCPGDADRKLAAPAAQQLIWSSPPMSVTRNSAMRPARVDAASLAGRGARRGRATASAWPGSRRCWDSGRPRLRTPCGSGESRARPPEIRLQAGVAFYWRDRGLGERCLWTPLQASREAIVTFGSDAPGRTLRLGVHARGLHGCDKRSVWRRLVGEARPFGRAPGSAASSSSALRRWPSSLARAGRHASKPCAWARPPPCVDECPPRPARDPQSQ